MLDEFERLCEGFTFLDSWDGPEITSENVQIYARNVPAKEYPHYSVYSVKRLHSKIIRNQIEPIF